MPGWRSTTWSGRGRSFVRSRSTLHSDPPLPMLTTVVKAVTTANSSRVRGYTARVQTNNAANRLPSTLPGDPTRELVHTHLNNEAFVDLP
jgi:hypothetical protein